MNFSMFTFWIHMHWVLWDAHYRVIHRIILSANQANHVNHHESSHIIHIWKEEELLCHITQDLWGCMRIHMNCMAMNRISQELWESFKKNQESWESPRIVQESLESHWESVRIIWESWELGENWSRIMTISVNHWEAPRITKKSIKITQESRESLKINKNCQE